MAFTWVSLLDFGLAPSADVLTRGFTGYFVAIASTPAMLAGMARADSVDFGASRIALRDGEPVGAALVARRGWTSRVAGMAIVPEARRSGVGRALMNQLLAEAAARGDRFLVLEVIEQNEAAVRLYESCGFARVRRLTGYAGRPEVGPSSARAELIEIDPAELGRLVAVHGEPDLPWQLSAETIAHAVAPARAYRLGPSAALISDPSAATIGLRCLLTEQGRRGEGHATNLLRALMAAYPGKEWRAPAIFPEEMEPVFVAAGLARTPLSQWQMVRPVR